MNCPAATIEIVSDDFAFGAIPKRAIADQRLNRSDLRVLGQLSHDTYFGKCETEPVIRRDYIAGKLNVAPQTVTNCINKLCHLGYVNRDQSSIDGRSWAFSVQMFSQQYARVPLYAIRDNRLSLAAFRLFCACCLYDHNKGEGCYASKSTLARQAGIKTEDVTIRSKILEQKGWIVIRPTVRSQTTCFVQFQRPFPNGDNSAIDPTALEIGNQNQKDRTPQNRTISNEINDIANTLYLNREYRLSQSGDAAALPVQASDLAYEDDELVRRLVNLKLDRETAWNILLSLDPNKRNELRLASISGALEDEHLLQLINAYQSDQQ